MKIKPVLYILMRNDLESLNAGKAMAQASHASNAFVKKISSSNENDKELYELWKNETNQDFGTVIVLAVNEQKMNSVIDNAKKIGLVCDIIHDPTYPLIDGNFCHYIPLNTCGFVFGDKNDISLKSILQNIKLY